MNERQLDELVQRELTRFPWLTPFELAGRLQAAGLPVTASEVQASRERLGLGQPSALPKETAASGQGRRRRFGLF